MSSNNDSVEYNFNVSASQPDAGGGINIGFTIVQTADFGDAQAGALFTGLAAQVPSGWAVYSSLTKFGNNVTQWAWDATAQAFE